MLQSLSEFFSVTVPSGGIFITGPDTGVGKTYCATALLCWLAGRGYRVAGMKPVAAGADERDGVPHNEDDDALRAASNVDLPVHLTCPYRLREPASPHIAAAIEQVTIEPAHIGDCYRQLCAATDRVVVEGSGGWLAPIDRAQTMADIALALELPVILVVGMRLGCLNHAQLTANAIKASGLHLAGWIANAIDPAMPHREANIAWLDRALGAPRLDLFS